MTETEMENNHPVERKILSIIGWAATVMAVAMYVAYIPQIQNNLNGQKGDWLQPLVATFNSALWLSYGAFRRKKDWPIVLANLPGIVFGLLAFWTAL